MKSFFSQNLKIKADKSVRWNLLNGRNVRNITMARPNFDFEISEFFLLPCNRFSH